MSGREMTVKIRAPPVNANPIVWLEEAVRDIFTRAMQGYEDPGNYVGFSFNASCLTNGSAGLSFRPANACHYEDLWKLIFSVTQSAAEFVVDQTFTLTASRVSVPMGRGRKAKPLMHEGVQKKSLLNILEGNLCFPRSLIAARAYVKQGNITNDGSGLTEFWSDVRGMRSKAQRDAAHRLCAAAGVEIPAEGCGMAEIALFQTYLATEGLVIVVYDFDTLGRGGELLYNGEAVVLESGHAIQHRLNILYLPRRRHFKPILNIAAAAATRRFCEPCNVGYRAHDNHKCSHKCSSCAGVPECDISTARIACGACKRSFYGIECLKRHAMTGSYSPRKSLCEVLQICEGCTRLVDRTKGIHRCGFAWCRVCGSSQPVNHNCYMKPVKDKADRGSYIFVFYDFETQQCVPLEGDTSANLHVPNLCIAQQTCTSCIDEPDIKIPCDQCGPVREFVFQDNPVKQLVDFVTRDIKQFRKIVCIAHNAQGFDSQFILRYLVVNNREPPRVILNGTKIILMETGHTRFLDSLAYMPMALSALPKAFGLPDDMVKGVFPHLFNRPENKGYVGPLPDPSYYGIDGMSASARENFRVWYDKSLQEGYVFNFDRELLTYCRLDVDILRKACVAYRKIFLSCGKVCPFTESTTIASTCNLVYRKNFLKPNTIGVIPSGGYRMACNQSAKAIKWLVWVERQLGVDVAHTGRGREFIIPETGRPVDGYCPDGKQVFEFHGCYWHGCPLCHTVNRDNDLTTGGSMDKRFEETTVKTARMKDLGYRVVELWECEFDAMYTDDANDEFRRYVDNHALVRAATIDVLNPRDAFFGGRTGNTFRYYEAAAGEQIHYADVCSLYPYVCKNFRYPVGHPSVYVGDECEVLTGDSGNNDIAGIEGLIKCTVLPPRDLYHPVLPVHMRGKLMFPLCRSCCENLLQTACPHDKEEDRWLEGTWVSDELKKAVSLGYRIISVKELWHYSESSKYDPVTGEGGHFTPYIDLFLKIKQEASGWPGDCVDEDSRDFYVSEYERVEGIKLDRENIIKNPGLRSVSKLCLNSFWGKFGQRENLPQTEVIYSRQRLMELLVGPDTEIMDILPVTNDVLYARWQNKRESTVPSPLTNVVIAAYTTAHARLTLYGYLEALGRRVLYFDTDSVIYVCRGEAGEYKPEVGNFLGQLTNELEQYGAGSYIREFVSGGPKFYAFIVCRGDGSGETEVCKVKGITLNYESRLKVNFNSIRSMVVDAAEPISVKRQAIRRTKLHQVITREESKICRPVQTKRRCCEGSYDTLPYGYID